MEALADLIRSVERNSILIDDFNLPEIDWQAGQARGSSKKSSGGSSGQTTGTVNRLQYTH